MEYSETTTAAYAYALAGECLRRAAWALRQAAELDEEHWREESGLAEWNIEEMDDYAAICEASERMLGPQPPQDGRLTASLHERAAAPKTAG